MAGFWKRGKGKKGDDNIVLPDVPRSEPRRSQLGPMERLQPLISAEDGPSDVEANTAHIDAESRLARAAGSPDRTTKPAGEPMDIPATDHDEATHMAGRAGVADPVSEPETAISQRRSSHRGAQDVSDTIAAASQSETPVIDDVPEEATRIMGARPKSRPQAVAAPVNNPAAIDDPMENPIVGWLVITDGPGQGHSLPLGYGTNQIGRGPELRVSLPFGDSQISRGAHAVITYDPRGRKFYIQHSGGTNLTYLGDAPVLEVTVLSPRDRIIIGDTVMMFVPLCDEGFDWQDVTD